MGLLDTACTLDALFQGTLELCWPEMNQLRVQYEWSSKSRNYVAMPRDARTPSLVPRHWCRGKLRLNFKLSGISGVGNSYVDLEIR